MRPSLKVPTGSHGESRLMVEEMDLSVPPRGVARVGQRDLQLAAGRSGRDQGAPELGDATPVASQHHEARAGVAGGSAPASAGSSASSSTAAALAPSTSSPRRCRSEDRVRHRVRVGPGDGDGLGLGAEARVRDDSHLWRAKGSDAQPLGLRGALLELAAMEAVEGRLVARVHRKVVLRLHAIPEGRPAALPQHPVIREVAVLFLLGLVCPCLLLVVRVEVDQERLRRHVELGALGGELVVPAHAVLAVPDEALLVVVRHRTRHHGVGLAAKLVLHPVRRVRRQKGAHVVTLVARVVLARGEGDDRALPHAPQQLRLVQVHARRQRPRLRKPAVPVAAAVPVPAPGATAAAAAAAAAATTAAITVAAATAAADARRGRDRGSQAASDCSRIGAWVTRPRHRRRRRTRREECAVSGALDLLEGREYEDALGAGEADAEVAEVLAQDGGGVGRVRHEVDVRRHHELRRAAVERRVAQHVVWEAIVGRAVVAVLDDGEGDALRRGRQAAVVAQQLDALRGGLVVRVHQQRDRHEAVPLVQHAVE